MEVRPAVVLQLRGRGERLFDAEKPLLVSRRGACAPEEIAATEVVEGDYVAIDYGGAWNSELSVLPSLLPRPLYGSEKRIQVPTRMTDELALFLGA